MSEPNQDTELYSLVATEMEGSDYNKGLWAKCFAECEGDGNKAKALYLKERIEQLKEQSFPLHHVNSTNSPDSDKPAEEQHIHATLVDISINLKVEFGLDVVPVQSGFFSMFMMRTQSYVIGFMVIARTSKENTPYPVFLLRPSTLSRKVSLSID